MNSDISLSCSRCALNRVCLPANLSQQEARILDGNIERDLVLDAGASLVRAGTQTASLHVIRSGSAKSCYVTEGGDELVRCFHLPGEIIGLEAFGDAQAACDVVALEPSACCRIPLRQIEQLMTTLPGLRREILRLLGQSLEEAQRLRTELAKADARGRIAQFLVSLSHRLERRGLPATQFRLSMSRKDIALHLGLTLETVSRVVGIFKREGSLEAQARYIKLLKPEALASPAS